MNFLKASIDILHRKSLVAWWGEERTPTWHRYLYLLHPQGIKVSQVNPQPTASSHYPVMPRRVPEVLAGIARLGVRHLVRWVDCTSYGGLVVGRG